MERIEFEDGAVIIGFGCIIALHDYGSTLYQIYEQIRYLYF